jgi:hypothetical protein
MADVDVYDIKVRGKRYTDKAGKKRWEYKLAGVAFDPKNGEPGMNGEPFENVGINGPFIIRLRKERTARAVEPEFEDDGADFLE